MHSVRFSFNSPESLPKRIRLYVVGEDGSSEQVKLEKAYINGRSLKVRDGEVVDLAKIRMREGRVQIEMKATRRIADKRGDVRFI